MLTAAEALQVERRRRPRPSLRQQYDEYILQRIEGYKNSVPRHELLRLGDQAAGELQAAAEGQFVLTEVLMMECVDELIRRRLKLKSFRRWKSWIRSLRDAQREPTHWGVNPECPVIGLLRRIEPDDHALVVGPAGEGVACLLAAHEMAVTFMAADIGSVDRVESRFESEALAAAFESYVVDFATWLPPIAEGIAIVVLDAGALRDVDPIARGALIQELQSRTAEHGVHVLLPGKPGLAPEALLSAYDGWTREEVGKPRRRGTRSRGIVVGHPQTEPTSASANGLAAS
jgi:hypothetical protein